MRAPIKATALLAVLVLASFSLAGAQSPDAPAVWTHPDSVTGLDANGYLQAGVSLEIPIFFHNTDGADDFRTAISNGYYFDSPDGVTIGGITVANNCEYNVDIACAIPNGCYPFDPFNCYSWFDMYFDKTPLTKGLGGFGIAGLAEKGTGLPVGFDDWIYKFTVTNPQGGQGASLVLDTTYWEPGNFWLWTGVGGNVSWSGPHTFQFEPGQCEAPTFTDLPPDPSDGLVGELFTFDVNATGDPVIEFTVVGPTGMTIGLNDGVINWTPTADQTGANVATITASNNCDPDATYEFTINVVAPCVPPLFTSVPAEASDGQVGEVFQFTVTASGDPVPDISLGTAPDGMTITNGVINWKPVEGQEGPNAVQLIADNDCEPNDTYDFVITVIPAFRAPVITAIADQTANEGETFTYDVDLDDIGYPIPPTFTVDGPTGMVIDPISGVITWTAEIGTHAITVTAANTEGLSDDEDFTLTVSGCSPHVTCYPETTVLKALENDRRLDVLIWCDDFANINWETIRVFNIPTYSADLPAVQMRPYAINGEDTTWAEALVTDAFIFRFLGAGGMRPITAPIIDNPCPVYYDYKDATPSAELSFLFNLNINVGDVTFDGVVNIEDAVFMVDWLFNGGPRATLWGENVDEFMDVDGSGRIDLLDARAIIDIVMQ